MSRAALPTTVCRGSTPAAFPRARLARKMTMANGEGTTVLSLDHRSGQWGGIAGLRRSDPAVSCHRSLDGFALPTKKRDGGKRS
jgi:hypothetical protein